jgi:predicted SprT family Zn-dependent metalloprotease
MQADRATIETRRTQIAAEVNRCIAEGKRLYNLDLSVVKVRLDVKGRAAGWAICDPRKPHDHGRYTIRLNVQMICAADPDAFNHILDETISHEMAHIICGMNPRLGRKHDAGWKAVHKALGGGGKRCHSVDTQTLLGGYDYMSTTGKIFTFTQNRHTKIQRGMSYTLRKDGGQISRSCPMLVRRPGKPQHTKEDFLARGHAIPAYVAPTPPPPRQAFSILPGSLPNSFVVRTNTTQQFAPRAQKVPALNNGMSKAEQVRQMIRHAKAIGHGIQTVIMQARTQLNMANGQATRYVTENWDRA